MGNRPAKQEKEELLLKMVPPIDTHVGLTGILRESLAPLHENPWAIKPPDHYIEQMRLCGWLDLDLDDPEINKCVCVDG